LDELKSLDQMFAAASASVIETEKVNDRAFTYQSRNPSTDP